LQRYSSYLLLQFLLDLEKIFFKYFAISFAGDSIIMSYRTKVGNKIFERIGRWKIYNFIGKKIFTKL